MEMEGLGQNKSFSCFHFSFYHGDWIEIGNEGKKKWERESAELKMDQSEREHVDNVPDIERQNENIDT